MTAVKIDETKLKNLREAGLLPKYAEGLLEEGLPTEAIRVELKDGPRTGAVQLSTILKTGKLTARDNLDAQAEIDAKHKPTEAKPAPTSPPTPPPDKAPVLSSTQKSATPPKPMPEGKADTAQKETPVKTRTATAAKRSRSKPSTTKKPAGERRKVKSDNARKPVDKKPKQPKGMVIEILKLAGRTNGVSRDELIALTEWKGAPWKWLFKNKNKTGYCDRWGYTLQVIEGKDGETRYKVEKKD